ncbi:hypothetical protein [Amycolatopsis viridis]|uniref:Glyoxalase-like domain-containing protein n=1 Tax=Amycolatopsis viridis TaxID=185678 RepID=A0ABX0SQ36_9PSEU|nr:hypothetical protein [Amycolatopsis viridis]NIH79066.1 hypothetical protein [Amycolatopsis viridis]
MVRNDGFPNGEVIPILRVEDVEDAAAAVAWYERLGFAKQWEHRFEPERLDEFGPLNPQLHPGPQWADRGRTTLPDPAWHRFLSVPRSTMVRCR